MARPRAGLSGTALFVAVGGLYLAYAGIRDVALVDGLRSLLQGQRPAEAATAARFRPFTLTAPDSAAEAGVESAEIGVGLGVLIGPVPESATRLVPGTSIRVHTSIYNRVVMMVAAAKIGGVTLDGWGWRSVDAQRALRAQHGYTSDDQTSGSGGRTPVARPGRSMHERGLAIDFKGMRRGDKAYNWLKANAGTYGLKNLPSEAWHWSTTGS